jgi:hypothetical protein
LRGNNPFDTGLGCDPTAPLVQPGILIWGTGRQQGCAVQRTSDGSDDGSGNRAILAAIAHPSYQEQVRKSRAATPSRHDGCGEPPGAVHLDHSTYTADMEIWADADPADSEEVLPSVRPPAPAAIIALPLTTTPVAGKSQADDAKCTSLSSITGADRRPEQWEIVLETNNRGSVMRESGNEFHSCGLFRRDVNDGGRRRSANTPVMSDRQEQTGVALVDTDNNNATCRGRRNVRPRMARAGRGRVVQCIDRLTGRFPTRRYRTAGAACALGAPQGPDDRRRQGRSSRSAWLLQNGFARPFTHDISDPR